MILSAPQIATLARKHGFTGADVAIAVAVALAESGGNTTATHKNTNGTIDRGLMQINSIHGNFDWANPDANMEKAHQIWKDAGGSWKPWSTFKSQSYLKFWTQAVKAAGTGDTALPTQTVSSSGNPFQPIIDFATFIGDGHNWVRIGMFAAGGILLLIALARLTGASQLVNAAASVVPAGRVVKAAV